MFSHWDFEIVYLHIEQYLIKNFLNPFSWCQKGTNNLITKINDIQKYEANLIHKYICNIHWDNIMDLTAKSKTIKLYKNYLRTLIRKELLNKMLKTIILRNMNQFDLKLCSSIENTEKLKVKSQRRHIYSVCNYKIQLQYIKKH